jgi:ABC-type polysaccharide/polyol phosphate export permease
VLLCFVVTGQSSIYCRLLLGLYSQCCWRDGIEWNGFCVFLYVCFGTSYGLGHVVATGSTGYSDTHILFRVFMFLRFLVRPVRLMHACKLAGRAGVTWSSMLRCLMSIHIDTLL